MIEVTGNQILITAGGRGAQGVGVPTGGNAGQALFKASDTDYDTAWQTVKSTNVDAVAGQTISALKIVSTSPATGKIEYADKDDIASVYSLLGIATQAGSLDDTLNVITSGELTDDAWAWDMDSNVNLFLGADGAIVQGAPTGAVVIKIGYAITATKIIVRIGQPILT